MLALLLAAALVPAQADGALVLDGAHGADGLRALLEKAGTYTASLSPDVVGESLRTSVGVNLLAEQPSFALAPKGARVLAFWRKSAGLSAPVTAPRKAREAAQAWVRGQPANRAARVAAGRVLLASGPQAAKLLKLLAHMKALPKPLSAHATGPAWLWLAGQSPLKAAVFAIDASSTGLVARGTVVPLKQPILAAPAPDGCEGNPPGCLRAGLGPSGRALLDAAFARLGLGPPPDAASVIVRLLGIDASRLTDDRSLPRALHVIALAAPPAAQGAALTAYLDLADIDRALAKLSPLDTLRGSLAAGAYAAHLLYAPLLRNAGPLSLAGTAAPKGAAEIEIRLPLR